MLSYLIKLAEKGILPDFIIRLGIRKLCGARLNFINKSDPELVEDHHQLWVEKLRKSPVALVPEKANEQHYEVPPEFFNLVLGKHLKYSSGYWLNDNTSLDESEEIMLGKTCNRAELKDGQSILELGCGWGSLTCYMAKKFPNSKITAVSNSSDQKKIILKRCELEKIKNVSVITADMNVFSIDKKFDRIVSVEMFEHMRNYEILLERISSWLKDDGKLFVHIFSHGELVYPFENKGEGDWMAREFFSGGIMPSHKLLLHFSKHMKIESLWKVSGVHYSRTSLAWLRMMDKNRLKILDIFSKTYGYGQEKKWFQRWRIFFMSCEELFGYDNGTQWGVSHYRFSKA